MKLSFHAPLFYHIDRNIDNAHNTEDEKQSQSHRSFRQCRTFQTSYTAPVQTVPSKSKRHIPRRFSPPKQIACVDINAQNMQHFQPSHHDKTQQKPQRRYIPNVSGCRQAPREKDARSVDNIFQNRTKISHMYFSCSSPFPLLFGRFLVVQHDNAAAQQDHGNQQIQHRHFR